MQVDELCELGVLELARRFRQGEISPVEVVDAHLRRCASLNPTLNAFLSVFTESAVLAARSAESLFRAGVDLGPLQGVPISVKDMIRVKGSRTTAASRLLLEAPLDGQDASVVRSLRAAGAVLLGKTNLHEFASGDPDPAGPFGLVQNPRKLGYNPGMSSSGAASATAAGMGVVALGTDTGGSVRIPAYLCGVVGLKPTTGRIQMHGVIPLSTTLDTIGFLGRRVEDVAAAWHVCAPALDTEATKGHAHYLEGIDPSVRGMRIGVLRGGLFEQTQRAVAKAFDSSLKAMQGMGCRLYDVEAPTGLQEMVDLSLAITRAEAATYHERHRADQHLYGSNFVAQRLEPGRGMSASAYLSARQKIDELQATWRQAVQHVEFLVMPTGPIVAPTHGTETIELGGNTVPFRGVLSRFVRVFNCLGWPALTIPNGMSDDGLPTGLQVAALPDGERGLLALGRRIESELSLGSVLCINPQ